MKQIVLFSFLLCSITSCVSKKDFSMMEQSRNAYMRQAEANKTKLDECELNREALVRQIDRLKVAGETYSTEAQDYEKKIVALEKELTRLETLNENHEKNNTILVDQLESLSLINQQGSENIKKSLETLNQQSSYIKTLNNKIQSRDSINILLANTLKRSLADINDDDINVEVEGSVVFISISDKMMFDSGKYSLKPDAKTVLGKIATIANDHTQLDLLVEGHTDNVPVKTGAIMKDNWDLSALRATAVVRSLQTEHQVDPSRMTAAGRSQYLPKSTNDTATGRALNRRTKIYLLPKLDQFFQLVEEGVTSN